MQPAQNLYKKESPTFPEVTELLESAVEEGVFPGAVLVVGKDGREIYRQAVGNCSYKSAKNPDPKRMQIDSVFDVAGLTATVVTTTLLMHLIENGKLKLGDMVTRYLQGFSVHGKSPITFAHLLSHTAGLAAWHPFFEELLRENESSRTGILTSKGARDHIFTAIKRSELKYEIGSRQVYSDLGFMLLGHLIESLTGLSLDRAAQQIIFQPLGLKSTSFVDLSMVRRRGIHPVKDVIAPTEDCSWRKRVLWGEVHDDNAWAMGGVAGHSGLFSTALDLQIFAREMLLAFRGQSAFLSAETIHAFWQELDGVEGSTWRFGWDSPSAENGLNESNLSPYAVGACGFTGCSLWIDPKYGLDVVLMSNRIHPSRSNKKIRAFRPEIHNAVLKAVGVH